METRIITQTSTVSNYEGRMLNRKENSASMVSTSATTRQLRPHSTPATLTWLEENYEIAQGVCVPRNTLYLHYVNFCSKNGMTPVNAASFGKIIRQQFPLLTTRRLGTRGQSRYHYYGIAIRETSPYYELIYSKKGLQATEEMRKHHFWQIPAPNCSSRSAKIATRLPEFPNLRDLCLPPSVPEERISTFIMMYRAHCHRLLDTIIRASFEEVQTFLMHYWKSMPHHLVGVLGSNVIVNIVGVCDSILYRSVCSVFMPSVLRSLPDALVQMIRKFASELESWLQTALEDLPDNLRAIKIDLVRHFCHMIRRQASLNNIFQAVRLALHDTQIHSVLIHDWQRQEISALVKSVLQASYSYAGFASAHTTLAAATAADSTSDSRKRRSVESANRKSTIDLLSELCIEFERLLQEQAPLEAYTEWIETIVDRCILQPTQMGRMSLRKAIRKFLLTWATFGSRVLREVHVSSAFGTFNLLRIMIDDYFLYLVELLHIDERARELMRNITLDAPPQYADCNYEDFLSAAWAGFGVGDAHVNMSTSENSPAIHYQASSTPHYSDAVLGENVSAGSNLNDDGTSSPSQNIAVPDYLPNSIQASSALVSNHENSFTYDYNARASDSYKFQSNETVCHGYSYANNQVASYGNSNFSESPSQEYVSYSTRPSQYRRGDYNDHCPTGGFYSEQINLVATSSYSTASPSIASGAEYYISYDAPTPSSEGISYVDLTESNPKLKELTPLSAVSKVIVDGSYKSIAPTDASADTETRSNL